MKKRVVIGLSGGVDSSVAALLLKEQDYDVIAVFMINWHDKTGVLKADCPWDEDVTFAEMVAKKLSVPFHVVDYSERYREAVVDYMFTEYQKGRTPNPDILCNREIKFNEFFRVLDDFDADFIATGHYCRKEIIKSDGNTIYSLLAGIDPDKEQSYFLCQLNQYQLSRSLFPLGSLHKSEVREIARKAGLPSAEKKDSQGICFVGKVDLPVFLQQKLEPRRGPVIEISKDWEGYKRQDFDEEDTEEICKPYNYHPDSGTLIGHHMGAHNYTLGQRKGLNIGGKSEPLFIIATDTVNNIVYTGQGKEHPGLFRKGLFIPDPDVHWIRPDLEMQPGNERSYKVRIRYRQSLQKAKLIAKEKGLYIVFDRLQRGITPGQFAAWYDKEEVLGSGEIY